MDLSTVSTQDLIKELAGRPGIKKISVGSWKPYELREKHVRNRSVDGTRGQIEAETVLVVTD